MEIVGIGNALMDVIAFVDEAFAPAHGFHNNAVAHLDRERLDGVLFDLRDPVTSAGGGAANAVRVASMLGSRAAYVGCVGRDGRGDRFREDLQVDGVDPILSFADEPTGVYCALVRPEGGRTLLVCPGAALRLTDCAPPDAVFQKGAILYLEGFLLGNRGYFFSCLSRAREAGMEIALDLGSHSLVRAQRDFILEILPEYCDILFANQDEFEALCGLSLREGLGLLGSESLTTVVKLAEKGAVWSRGGISYESPVRAIAPVDETGAGDAFAAGFLVGRSLGLPPERCLRVGNRMAEEVLNVPGLGVDSERLRKAAGDLGV
ncbi:MAG: adenosine kinase [Spirochaetaceae bacterium]|nr:adenosine kinase [Spirochaetaceae bacterium]